MIDHEQTAEKLINFLSVSAEPAGVSGSFWRVSSGRYTSRRSAEDVLVELKRRIVVELDAAARESKS